MTFFRRNLDVSIATTRQAAPGDITGVSRLLRDGAHRYMGFPGSDLPSLMDRAPGMVLVSGRAIWGVVLAGFPLQGSVWLRGFGLTDGLAPKQALEALLPPLHDLLRSRGLNRVFYAGDVSADRWLQPVLTSQGYVHDTDVIVYEKHRLTIPGYGNSGVRVRRAEPADLPAVLAVDHACFIPQWMKDESILAPAMSDAPLFVVAEQAGQITGYAFASSHFGGRLVHLVRIAVHPAFQGQSIGVRLLSEVVSFAREAGAHTVALNTQIDNHSAHRLYEWFGFRRTGEQQTVLRYDL